MRLAVKIHCTIASNGRKPRGKAGHIAQGRETGKSLKEDILDKVFGSRTGHATKKNAVDHPSVARVKSAESGAVALLRGTDERFVGPGIVRWAVHGNPTRDWGA
jgi:hypothetical protein